VCSHWAWTDWRYGGARITRIGDGLRLLIVVEDTFEFQDGSLHFSPLATASAPDGLKAGGRLELRRPDGTRIYPTLYGLDWPSPSRGKLGLSVDKSLTKADVPFGTEICTAS
jgi:hypothetical protein